MTSRTTQQRDARWWLGAGLLATAGAAAAYLLDPQQGRSRRIRIADRSAHSMRRVIRLGSRNFRYLRTTLIGKTRHLMAGTHPAEIDGRTLLDRVESELFADSTIPHGRFGLEVEGKTVILRGQLDSPAEIARVEAAVAAIPGVFGVRGLLHLPGSAAPNKVAALAASAHAKASGGWPDEPPPDVDSEP